MGKNTKSFLSWQGNNLEYWKGSTFVTIGLILLIMLAIFLSKNKIKSFVASKENNKILFFKNINSLLQWAGIFMLIYFVFREVILIGYEYPKKWEYIPIHLCRLHTIIIAVMFVLKKKEWNEYISIISFLGAVFGLAFGNLSASPETLNDTTSVFNKAGIEYYSAGVDTLFFWDFLSSHIFIAVVPFIFSCISKPLSKKAFWVSITTYFIFTVVLWTINLATSYVSDPSWRSNFWYLGTNEINPFSGAAGPITAWPANVILMPLFAVMLVVAIHTLTLLGKNKKQQLKEFYSCKITKKKTRKQ